MLSPKSGGSIARINTSSVDHPIADIDAALVMITMGG
jgi:hypothetical protein